MKKLDDKIAINIIFDGAPSHESGRFVEVETDDGKSINIGEWIERDNGLWALRINSLPSESERLSNEMQYPPKMPGFEGTREALGNLTILDDNATKE